jgi:hypothetical protein
MKRKVRVALDDLVRGTEQIVGVTQRFIVRALDSVRELDAVSCHVAGTVPELITLRPIVAAACRPHARRWPTHCGAPGCDEASHLTGLDPGLPRAHPYPLRVHASASVLQAETFALDKLGRPLHSPFPLASMGKVALARERVGLAVIVHRDRRPQ